MKNRIARFEKISLERFMEDVRTRHGITNDAKLKDFYENVVLPVRSTEGSAGYDIVAPYSFHIKPGKSFLVHTGIRCRIDPDYVLLLMPRSSLGTKYKISLDNTVGVIDSDYYYTDNEGHILVSLRNNGINTFYAEEGSRIAQGIFLPFGITEDDDVKEIRTGGFGSTGR